MKDTTGVTQTLGRLRDQVDAGSYNMQRVGDPSARTINASLTMNQLGGGAYLPTITETRNVNPLQEKACIEQVTKLENLNAYTEFLSTLQQVIGDPNDPQQSVLVKSIDAFFSQSKLLEANSGTAMRQAFIDKAEAVSRAITSVSEKTTDLRLDADARLVQGVKSANTTIKQLFLMNQQIIVSNNKSIRLFDQRDALIRDLAQNFDIKVSYNTGGNKIPGTVEIQSKSSGKLLVTSEYYTELSYQGALSKEVLLQNDIEPINLTMFDRNGKKVTTGIFIGGTDDSTKNFTGGKLSALIDIRDNVLLDVQEKVKTLGRNFATEINKIHNDGSPFPPKGLFESSIDVSHNQVLEWGQDPIDIYLLDANGDQLRGGAGRLNKVSIDMQALGLDNPNGNATVGNLLKELNEKLNDSLTRERAVIGSIYDNPNTPNIPNPNEFLINNIQLRARSPINALDNNSFTFDLDLQGNSHFGSTIEVLDITTNTIGGGGGITVPPDQLPSAFRLEKDANTATGQGIRVEGAILGRQIQLIIRVTGDNGQVSEGLVSFRAPTAVDINTRIAYDSSLLGSAVGDFAALPPAHSGVATAMLVDENGNEVTEASGQNGKLVIKTIDDSYRLAIHGGDFNSLFDMNDLFEFTELTGALNVKQEIVDDLGKLSLGKAHQDSGVVAAYSVGDVQAQATLLFGGGAFAVNDTVTIQGTPFAFVNVLAVPNNPNQVLLVDGLGGANGLVSRINAHPQIKGLIEATLAGATVTITSKAAGTGGNAITIASNLVGGATIDLNAGGAPNGVIAGTLIGGTNKVDTSSVFSYNIKQADQQSLEELSNLQTKLLNIEANNVLPYTITTLSGLATVVTGLISDSINDAQVESDVAQKVLETTYIAIKDFGGIRREDEYLKLLETSNLMIALSRLMSIIQNTIVKTQDIIFG